MLPTRLPILLVLALSIVTIPASTQGAPSPRLAWTFHTSAFISGNSDDSDPAGYTVYSGIGLTAGIQRQISNRFALDLSARTESREVDLAQAAGTDLRLGSLELLPVTLVLKWRPPVGGAVRPFIGAGLNVTVAWEKSGVLDSMDVSPGVGPALQLGADFALSPTMLFTVGVGWNAYSTDVSTNGTPVATLKVDPVLLTTGIGFRF